VRLGKTLRILQERLPTLLQSPLPQEVLSPNITLHLFPSTHPHLPTVTGRVAYAAALWTSPIAWNRVPIIGSVRLEILSERMVDPPSAAHGQSTAAPRPEGAVGERLVVRWRTKASDNNGRGWSLPFIGGGSGGGNKNGNATDITMGGNGTGTSSQSTADAPSSSAASSKAPVGNAQPVGARKEFTGLFIFDFDNDGRILSHTIEHVEESGQWDRGVGARVVGLTDWLLGNIKGAGEGAGPCPAFARCDNDSVRRGKR